MNLSNKALIFDIQRGSFVDGPGIRTTVFFKGCNLKCKWCHNPESQSKNRQVLFYKNKCTNCGKCKVICANKFEKCDFCGKCALFCPNDARELCGKEYSIEDVLSEVIRDKDYYGADGGVTFSGGECMLQIEFLQAILKQCKENGIHTAVDTAGNVPWQCFEKVLPYTDLFLYDIKCVANDLHKEGTGVSNELILDNLKKLCRESNTKVIVRIPVIGGFNDNEKEFLNIKNFINKLKLKEVELLPYHAMGEHKWEAIGKKAVKYYVPSKDFIEKKKREFSK